MIAMVRPLVKAANKSGKLLSLVSLYAIGAVASSMTLGALLGLLGVFLVPGHWTSIALAIVGSIGVLLALCDFGVGGTKTPTLRRQTCPGWWRTLGPARTMLLWGIDLGLGFSTIRVASLYWIVTLAVFVLASPLTGAAILSGYGIALVVNLCFGVIILEPISGSFSPIRVLELSSLLKRSLAVILLFWSAFLLASLL
jgi:hypothetical protein